MKLHTSLVTVSLTTFLAAPAVASMSWTAVAAAPTLSPLGLAGLAAVIGIAGVRMLRNQRRG